ncbi:unnamed protein product [Urochloa humidicola]
MGGRRLTLAPAARRALRPRGEGLGGVEESDKDDDEDRRCKEGREALTRVVSRAVEASARPRRIHGVERINSKFWAREDSDSDSSVDEELIAEDISTPEFIAEAAAAGFSWQELQQAERELASPEVSSKSGIEETRSLPSLASRIVSALVQRKTENRPWKGPLPPPRVSPPRTLGDAFASARRIKLTSSQWDNSVLPADSKHSQSLNRKQRSHSLDDKQQHGFASDNRFTRIQRLEPLPFCLSPANSGDEDRSARLSQGVSNDGEQVEADITEIQSRGFLNSKQNLIPREEKSGQVLIGPGRWFRPTPGLVSLFARTGTYSRQKPKNTKVQLACEPPRRTYAEVVREGCILDSASIGGASRERLEKTMKNGSGKLMVNDKADIMAAEEAATGSYLSTAAETLALAPAMVALGPIRIMEAVHVVAAAAVEFDRVMSANTATTTTTMVVTAGAPLVVNLLAPVVELRA